MPDPFFSNVVLLCHFDGADGATSGFIDNSGSRHVVTGNTNYFLTTAQARFGTSSLQSNGSAGLCNSTDSPDWDFGAGQFTVEAWVRRTANNVSGGISAILSQWGGASNLGWVFYYDTTSGTLNFNYSTTGTNSLNINGTYTPPLNTWVHFAADRDASNVLRLYADGVLIGSGTAAGTFFNSTLALVFANDFNNTHSLLGQVDEARITKGVARYAGAFSPPTAAFPDTGLNTSWSVQDKSTFVSTSGGNLTATMVASTTGWVRTVDRQVTGKFYWEVKPTVWGNASTAPGFGRGGFTPDPTSPTSTVVVQKAAGNILVDGVASGFTLGARAVNDVFGIAVDLDAGLAWFRVAPSGNWNGLVAADPATGAGGIPVERVVGGPADFALYPLALFGTNAESATANFGDTAFIGTVPGGFTSGFPAGATPTVSVLAGGMAREALVSSPGVIYLGGLVREALVGGTGLVGRITARSSATGYVGVSYTNGRITTRSWARAELAIGAPAVSTTQQYAVSIVV